MHDDWVLLRDLLQDVTRFALRIHIVFRDDFEPVDVGMLLEYVLKVRRS